MFLGQPQGQNDVADPALVAVRWQKQVLRGSQDLSMGAAEAEQEERRSRSRSLQQFWPQTMSGNNPLPEKMRVGETCALVWDFNLFLLAPFASMLFKKVLQDVYHIFTHILFSHPTSPYVLGAN